jgi:hypothetical protein
MRKQTLFERAIEQAGGYTYVAAWLGLSHRSAVHRWNSRGIPLKHVKKLCSMKGVKITPAQLRPDVF